VFRYTGTFGAPAAPLTLFGTARDGSRPSRPVVPADGAANTDVAQHGSDWTPERDTSGRGRDALETLLYFLAALMALVGGALLAGGKVLKRPRGPAAAAPGVMSSGRPVLFLDVDGVVALTEACDDAPPGQPYLLNFGFVWVSDACRILMGRLEERFELVWATGWEDRANLELPRLLGLSGDLHALSFGKKARYGSSEWKIPEVERYAGNRPVAWIDDNIDHQHEDWARKRSAPTLLMRTDPATGMAQEHVDRLLRWGERLAPELTTSGSRREPVTGQA
jgi:Swiss Army Knife RNA repair-like protein